MDRCFEPFFTTKKRQISTGLGLAVVRSLARRAGGDAVVTSTSGYEGRLSQAVVNTRTGNIVSEKPVVLKMLNGTINANAMEIEQAGEVIRFDGGVAMLLMPNKDQGNVAGQVPQ